MPACVKACPTGARHFGDLGDADSAVSQLVAERGGFDLLPEMGYKPVNKYLPPRNRAATSQATANRGDAGGERRHDSDSNGFFRWADRVLCCRCSRMHPAYSVILFTTASGAGYGLLALLGLVGFNHGPASSLWFGAGRRS